MCAAGFELANRVGLNLETVEFGERALLSGVEVWCELAELIEDVAAGRLLSPSDPSPEAIESLLSERSVEQVSFSGWERIDEAEVNRGEPHGRPRVKFASRDELLAASGRDGSGS